MEGGFDFSSCVTDPDTGLCCVDKEETVTSLEKEPILECTHKNVEQCHYTYVTQFTPSQEEVSAENSGPICHSQVPTPISSGLKLFLNLYFGVCMFVPHSSLITSRFIH